MSKEATYYHRVAGHYDAIEDPRYRRYQAACDYEKVLKLGLKIEFPKDLTSDILSKELEKIETARATLGKLWEEYVRDKALTEGTLQHRIYCGLIACNSDRTKDEQIVLLQKLKSQFDNFPHLIFETSTPYQEARLCLTTENYSGLESKRGEDQGVSR